LQGVNCRTDRLPSINPVSLRISPPTMRTEPSPSCEWPAQKAFEAIGRDFQLAFKLPASFVVSSISDAGFPPVLELGGNYNKFNVNYRILMRTLDADQAIRGSIKSMNAYNSR
jgi:hypothetical protein